MYRWIWTRRGSGWRVHRVWDVAEGLVRMCVFPNPTKRVRRRSRRHSQMPQDERWLTTGALVAFLQDVTSDGSAAAEKRCPGGVGAFADEVERARRNYSRAHFADAEGVARDVE